MIIDFLGFGGTGKTTFIKALESQLKVHKIKTDIYDRPNFKKPLSVVKWMTYLVLNPYIFIAASRLFLLIKGQQKDFTYLETLKRITLYGGRSKHNSDKIILSDEGLSVYLQHLKLPNVDANLKSLLPEVIVSLHVSEKERLSRLYARGGEIAKRVRYVEKSRFDVLELHYQIFRYHNADDDAIFKHFVNLNTHSFEPKLSEGEISSFIRTQERVLTEELVLRIEALESAKRSTHVHFVKVMQNNGVKIYRFDVSNRHLLELSVEELTQDLIKINVKA